MSHISLHIKFVKPTLCDDGLIMFVTTCFDMDLQEDILNVSGLPCVKRSCVEHSAMCWSKSTCVSVGHLLVEEASTMC